MTHFLAAEEKNLIQAGGFFLENVWIIPTIMAVSFTIILTMGKRMPKGGSEVGIAAVSVCFVLALLTAGQWVTETNRGETCLGDAIPCQLVGEGDETAAGVDQVGEDQSDEEVAAGFPVEDAGAGVFISEAAFEAGLRSDAFEGETAAAAGFLLVDEVGEGEAEPAYPLAVRTQRTWWSNDSVEFNVGTLVDGLTVTLLVVVTLVSTLVHVYSTDYVAGDRRYTHFFACL